MSEENLELIRRSVAAFNRGDFAEAAESYHPDAEWYPHLGLVDADVYRGRAAIVAMWEDIASHLSGFQVVYEELIDRGRFVVGVISAEGEGSGSGAGVEDRWAQLLTLEGGRIVRVEAFDDRETALDAVRERQSD